MIEDIGPGGNDLTTEEEEVRPGPLWRHAAWVVGIAVLGVGFGWTSALFRIGPEEYGLPSVAPGPIVPYLAVWTAIGLLSAAVLRAAAARVPVYAPETIALGPTWLGTRLSLGWRPEPSLLGTMAAVALAVAAVWCLMALRSRTGAEPTPSGAEPTPS